MNCKKCGSTIAPGSRFCPACGAEYQEEKKETAPQAPHCTKCGSALAPGSSFCPACGTAYQEEKKETAPQAPRCPKCGSAIAPGGKFCPACGTAYQEEKKGTAPQAPRCTKCGNMLEPGTKFCPACGTVQDNGTVPVTGKARGKRNGLDTAGYVCMLLAILLQWGTPSASDWHPGSGTSIEEFSNQITTYNIMSIALLVAGAVLFYLGYRKKKQDGGQ